MRFKKINEDMHGPIVRVLSEHEQDIGTIHKWHGLFLAKDWHGETVSPWPVNTRKEAAELLLEKWTFEMVA